MNLELEIRTAEFMRHWLINKRVAEMDKKLNKRLSDWRYKHITLPEYYYIENCLTVGYLNALNINQS